MYPLVDRLVGCQAKVLAFLHQHCICNLDKINGTYLSFVVVDLVEVVVIFRLIRIQQLVSPLTLSFIPNMMMLNNSQIQMSH